MLASGYTHTQAPWHILDICHDTKSRCTSLATCLTHGNAILSLAVFMLAADHIWTLSRPANRYNLAAVDALQQGTPQITDSWVARTVQQTYSKEWLLLSKRAMQGNC